MNNIATRDPFKPIRMEQKVVVIIIKQESVSVKERSANTASCTAEFDLLKTNICPRREAWRANMLVLRR